MDSKIDKVNGILDGKAESQYPERQVRIEKKDKGLYERTENSAILITEDNKVMLND